MSQQPERDEQGGAPDSVDVALLIQEAINTVNAFDQANTGSAIAYMGMRGKILKDQIRDLRKVLNAKQKLTLLTAEQAGET